MYEDEVVRTKYKGYYVHRGPLEIDSREESDLSGDTSESSSDEQVIKVRNQIKKSIKSEIIPFMVKEELTENMSRTNNLNNPIAL